MEHEHKCPKCGKTFEHDSQSRIQCPGPDMDWLCNRCYEESLWGPLKA